MELTLTTPALLFPAISLLLLAYTNRFLALASLIRNLKNQYSENQNPNLLGQISNIRKRILQVRNMQACGIMGFLICVLSMWLLYNNQQRIAEYAFGLSLMLLMISLLISFRETQISVEALEIELSDLEESILENKKEK
ncbi:uncharacterized protein DUF2721 [Arcticibacter tournemirensis]|uniref:DUF2721 domain-containing protein n=1 Tax=Arcticibacter tournemirensis TaxID=699437 RepID=A0A4Q0MB36_9SPHI|nr:DUF2721 domain-containing protein [Arcticibacter tournemirensis]KAA8480047.1 DUF2721 domain-containing protein [Arcticibacter tournemirensis]RXF70491.1 DUF2721 domain-containing protein [Arcticibacter tournemirensis]TQM50649.1 uncharacterized protein DUF2721 [Arcticibacter tournemirensis]